VHQTVAARDLEAIDATCPLVTKVHNESPVARPRRFAGRSLLDEIVGDGARQMLAAALQAEVAAYVDQFAVKALEVDFGAKYP
jgi:4-hydroxy-3-methylbut-2-enyl diphosphate reductase IspH